MINATVLFAIFFIAIPAVAIFASKRATRRREREEDERLRAERAHGILDELAVDFNPELAFKRVADRRGLTVEQLQEELHARAQYASDHPNECVFCKVTSDPVHSFESCPELRRQRDNRVQ